MEGEIRQQIAQSSHSHLFNASPILGLPLILNRTSPSYPALIRHAQRCLPPLLETALQQEMFPYSIFSLLHSGYRRANLLIVCFSSSRLRIFLKPLFFRKLQSIPIPKLANLRIQICSILPSISRPNIQSVWSSCCMGRAGRYTL